MRYTRGLLVSLLVLFAGIPAVAGTVVFSNLGQPGDTYGPDGISFGNNPYFPPATATGIVATRFHVNADSRIESVETELGVISGPPDFYGYILSETAGLPDQVILSAHFTDVAAGPQGTLPTTIPFPSFELLAGTPYWFGLSANPATFADWKFTPFYGDTGGSPNFGIGQISGNATAHWNIGIGGPLGREGAFRVIGNEVPEPAYGLPVLVGFLYVACRAARIRRSHTAGRWI